MSEPIDTGALTAEEYAEIHSVLTEYKRIVKQINEPVEVNTVRQARLVVINPVIEKMEKRMCEFPSQFV